MFFFFKQKTAYEMRISDWSSDVCSSDLAEKERARQTGGDAKTIAFLKRFTLFNVAQCEGLRPGLAAEPAPLPEREIVPVAEAVIAASGVDYRVGGNKAFYVPSEDYGHAIGRASGRERGVRDV